MMAFRLTLEDLSLLGNQNGADPPSKVRHHRQDDSRLSREVTALIVAKERSRPGRQSSLIVGTLSSRHPADLRDTRPEILPIRHQVVRKHTDNLTPGQQCHHTPSAFEN